jgi:hypothetical protein
MWSSSILDIGIGLAFMYLLLALICSVLQEFIANVTSWRGRHLLASVQAMLNDPNMTGLAKRLYANPRIKGLSFDGKLPSYIPSAAFSMAIIDTLKEPGSPNATLLNDGPLYPFIQEAAGDAEKLKASLENWFDGAMDRFGGWYKRNVQLVIFAMGLVLAIIMNANTIEVARSLWETPVLRQAVAQAASQWHDANPDAAKNPDLNALADQLDEDLPIGWSIAKEEAFFGSSSESKQLAAPVKDQQSTSTSDKPQLADAPKGARTGFLRTRAGVWLMAVVGWLFTAFAISLGAQFWFDTLGQALGLRAAGKKPS